MSIKDELLDHDLPDPYASEPKINITYAGFWIRVLATIVDMIALSPIIAFNIYNTLVLKSLILAILLAVILMVYKPTMEYLYGATLGKMAVKIKVVNTALEPLDLTIAILRYSPWLLSSITSLVITIMLFSKDDFADITSYVDLGLYQSSLGYDTINSLLGLLVIISVIAIVFNSKKQGLHDLIAGTYCIESPR